MGLPVPRLATPPNRGSIYYTVTAIDVWGRLADRSPLHRLHWRPGLSLAVSITQGAVLVIPHRDGRHSVTRQGHLRLPAAVRRVFRLEAGDRLLLAACPARNFLVAYPMIVVDAMLLAHHAAFHRTSR
ncbi:AbrB/MazE/SpoVT family DNA-binding domain-containing protein [Micromonospora rhizosphaerae]|uniref:AbrB/MazE/SpoVT family DNA-binding domain-containing protein n=1 Tax=Micromonospora rhizosphaerae TaxID=568872 RepID=UPI00114D03B1|nr:AbrB/MazE/SpoVT family DNA-binding domain-containing protein [Micromonospora rhizosphaerae]